MSSSVKDDIVVFLLQTRHQLLKTRRADKLGGVRRDGAGREDIQTGQHVALYRVVKLRHLADDVGESDVVFQLEDVVYVRTAKVAVDQQNPSLHLGEGDRQVGGNGTLAFTLGITGDGKDLLILCGEGEHDIGTGAFVGLDNGKFTLVGQRLAGSRLLFAAFILF